MVRIISSSELRRLGVELPDDLDGISYEVEDLTTISTISTTPLPAETLSWLVTPPSSEEEQ